MTRDPKVEEWLQTFTSKATRDSYASSFKRFQEFTGKTGMAMIEEQRVLIRDPDTVDTYGRKIFAFFQHLLTSKAIETGSVKGRAGGTTGRLREKTLSQSTAKHAVVVVQSFFAFHNLGISLKKFSRKDVKMQRPRIERKKHQLTAPEIKQLFNVAGLRDKCILALGLMGQDESTVAGLKKEDFTGKLDGVRLEFAELTRPKTNSEILLALTPEVQSMLKTYIATVEGPWLFPGYRKKHVENGQPNKIFTDLCAKAGLVDNGKRLSFHCCRLWFSARLRNKVSDDLIDYMTGHVLRFNGAYIPQETEQLRRLLTDAGILELLDLQGHEAKEDELAKEVATLRALVGHQAEQLVALQKFRESAPMLEKLLRRVSELEKRLKA